MITNYINLLNYKFHENRNKRYYQCEYNFPKTIALILNIGYRSRKYKDSNTPSIITENSELEAIKDLIYAKHHESAIQQANKPDINGISPLMYASYFGYLKIVELLVKNSANINYTHETYGNALLITEMHY